MLQQDLQSKYCSTVLVLKNLRVNFTKNISETDLSIVTAQTQTNVNSKQIAKTAKRN